MATASSGVHLILTGATGLVGSAVLHAMLRNPAIQRISVISRRDVQQVTDYQSANPETADRCIVYKHSDFATLPAEETLSKLRDAKGIVWALGISQNLVDEMTYQKITVDYPLLWARALAQQRLRNGKMDASASTESGRTASGPTVSNPAVSASTPTEPASDSTTSDPSTGDKPAATGAASDADGPFSFVYVSGEGATLSPGFFTPRFGRVKGVAEQSLLDLSAEDDLRTSLSIYNARAGVVDPADHAEITKYVGGDTRLQKKLEAPVRAVLRSTVKKIMSPTVNLGDALVRLAKGNGEPIPDGPGVSVGGRILGNVALRRIGGLDGLP